MIELIPAIDIIGGKCVRLTKGDFDSKTVYNDDPVAQAREFESLGFKRLHVVDLDGAKSGHPSNIATLGMITKSTDLKVDFGGGIKTDDDIKRAFDNGADMVSIGSIAVTNPQLFATWLETYGQERIILCTDVRDGKVSINGWCDNSGEPLLPLLQRYAALGVRNVLCTEISRDGTLQGPATDLYKEIMDACNNLWLIASGGVAGNDDILALEKAGVPSVVFGKAYYEGKLDIKQLRTAGIL